MRKEIVLDLETKSAPAGWGSRENLGELGISVVGVWTSESDQFKIYRENELPELAKILSGADHLIGFAINKFDIPVLQPHFDFDLKEVPVLDIFDHVSATLGHRVSLASLAKATLGAEKLGHGLEAVEWYRNGDWERLEKYCLQDVKLTRDLYVYGKEHGHLLFESYVDHKVVSVPVSWGMPNEIEIREIVNRAEAEKKALEIEYVSRENAGEGFLKTRKIEIQALRGDEIEAYDHLRKDVRIFRIGRIVAARILNEPSRRQPVAQSLFS